MGSPSRLCPLCALPGRYTVENCSSCGHPHCKRHIEWSGDRWLCRRCSKKEAEKARG